MKVISVENVSKKFVLAHTRSKNLADAARNIFSRSEREDFWALKDVSFDVEQGEALGIIGHNGAGKSTMLKLLTRIMQPTSGRIRTRGRISALIEVGAGFHPEMTGRENIYLNGSILGMTRREIDSKFDEIVAFAELEKFIDTPVKRYSSGMYARLGFAVAAHVDPEILIVDEVLSVGDSQFQAKCSEAMSRLCGSGVTVVTVTHNLTMVEALCKRCMVLKQGAVILDGSTTDAIALYAKGSSASAEIGCGQIDSIAGPIAIEKVTVTGGTEPDNTEETISPGCRLTISIDYRCDRDVVSPHIAVGINDGRIGSLVQANTMVDGNQPDRLASRGRIECEFASLPLKPRQYHIWFSIRLGDGLTELVPWQRIGSFCVEDQSTSTHSGQSAVYTHFFAPVLVPYTWKYAESPQDSTLAKVDSNATALQRE